MNTHGCPFYTEDGKLKFPLRALEDRAFIWPLPPPERFQSEDQLIIIPEQFREFYNRGQGILMAVGPGYVGEDEKFYPTSLQLQPGELVLYDDTVPWSVIVADDNGVEHTIVRCGATDIKCLLEETSNSTE